MLKLYNTLTRKKEIFKPLRNKLVGLYTCGPTVYWFAHIGNLRTYIFEDILKRVLEYNGFKVNHIMNITDVGHLTSDADTGEDKIEKAAKREKKTAWQIARFYEGAFKKDLKLLNIKEPSFWVRATETIKDQINFIKILEKKGYTYKIADGIYFDSSKIKDYGKLAGQKKRKLRAGARVEMVAGKKNPTDFALWKFSPPGIKRQMEWDSPWGRGFPGWHTECVVMAEKKLGIPFDIHCGGIDHIPIHHTNEIAQSEAVFGKILARFWLHGEFLVISRGRPDGVKMAKSEGSIVTLKNLAEKGFNPLSYRYLCLTAHYRSKLDFSWQSLKAAQNALNNLYQKTSELQSKNIPYFSRSYKTWYVSSQKKQKTENSSPLVEGYRKKFLTLINEDLDVPKGLALVWKVVKSAGISNSEKFKLLIDFDKVFGLNLTKIKGLKIPLKIKELAELREKYRKQKNWRLADKLRKEAERLGYQIEDTEKGPKIKKKG